jgi:hypothetical protein
MKVLVYSNVISSEIHIAIAIEIIENHLKKKDTVYFLSFESDNIGCYVHNLKNCKYCLKQKNYIIESLFKNKIQLVDLRLTNKKFNYPNFKNTNQLLEYKYDEMPIGELVMSTVTDHSRQIVNDIEKVKNFTNTLLNNGIELYLKTKKFINENEIKKVYVWNGRRSTEGPVIYAAKKNNIEFNTYITGGDPKSYMLQPTLTTHDLEYNKKRAEKFYNDYYLNEKKKLFYIDLAKSFFDYMRYGGKKVFGYPYYKDLFDDKVKIDTRKNNKKILTIFTSSYYEFFALGKDFRVKNNQDINHYKNILEILNSKKIVDNFDVRVRWHPNLSTAGEDELKDINKIIYETKNNIIHYSQNNKINSYKLLEQSDLVLSFGSTIGIEATYYGKPSILWGVAYYEDSGGVYDISSLNELENLLTKNLKSKPYETSLKFAFHEKMRGEFLYKHVYFDKNLRYYFKGKQVYKLNFYEKIIENFKTILKPFGLIKYGRKVLMIIKIIIGKKANKSFTPSEW